MTEPIGAHAAQDPTPEADLAPVNRKVRRKLSSRAFLEQTVDKMGQERGMDLVSDGPAAVVLEVSNPMLWTPAQRKAMALMQSDQDLDRTPDGEIKEPRTVNGVTFTVEQRFARALFPAELVDAFEADGGDLAAVPICIRELQEDAKVDLADSKSR